MKKLLFILAVSLMISACGHDLKPPTQSGESAVDQQLNSNQPDSGSDL
jgi:hypothetical protein